MPSCYKHWERCFVPAMVPIDASSVEGFLIRCHLLLLHFCSSNATILPAESTTISLPRQVPSYASSVGGILAQVPSPVAPFLQLQLVVFLAMAQGCKSLPISALIDIPVHFVCYLGLNFMFWGAVLFILGYISYGL